MEEFVNSPIWQFVQAAVAGVMIFFAIAFQAKGKTGLALFHLAFAALNAYFYFN
jgi:hypothetical protein